MRLWLGRLALALAVASPVASSAGGGTRGSHATGTQSRAVPGVTRDSHGKIARSPQALQHFKKSNPCPATGKTYGSCPGYTVDHVVPLKRGGSDSSSNMQWQTNAEAKQKDKWE